jgi:hypothetical protein
VIALARGIHPLSVNIVTCVARSIASYMVSRHGAPRDMLLDLVDSVPSLFESL